jgi:hypothetical protein
VRACFVVIDGIVDKISFHNNVGERVYNVLVHFKAYFDERYILCDAHFYGLSS